MNDKEVIGKAFRVFDRANKIWKKVSFWTKACDVENDAGETLEDTVGSIKGITSSVNVTEQGYAADASVVSEINNKIAILPDSKDLESLVYLSDSTSESDPVNIDADSLDGHKADFFATSEELNGLSANISENTSNIATLNTSLNEIKNVAINNSNLNWSTEINNGCCTIFLYGSDCSKVGKWVGILPKHSISVPCILQRTSNDQCCYGLLRFYTDGNMKFLQCLSDGTSRNFVTSGWVVYATLPSYKI